MKITSCMNIDLEILKAFGVEKKVYQRKEAIFREGDSPNFYYQILKGDVKLNNYTEDGKEFIHNILGNNNSFGEALLYIDKKYPINAIALTECTILQLPKAAFFKLMKENPELSQHLNSCLSHRNYYNTIMMRNLASGNPINKLKGVLNYLKSYHDCQDPYSYPIPLTRQQMADLTGLRVETVIRTLKKMESENLLQIKDRKIFY